MLLFQCALLLVIAAGPQGPDRVGVRLEDAQGLSADDGRRLTTTFAKALQDTTGIAAVVDERMWEEDCDKSDRCSVDIRARTGAKEIVFLKAYGAATRFRLIAERTDERSVVVRSVQADLSREDRSMDQGMKGFIEILFPSETKSATAASPATSIDLSPQPLSPPPSKGLRIAAWSAIGAGVASAGVATLFRLQSNSSRHDLETKMLTPDEISSDMSSVRTKATLSNLLFGTGAVLAVAGIIYLLDH